MKRLLHFVFIILLTTMVLCLFCLEAYAEVLYTNGFEDASDFVAYDPNGKKAKVMSVNELKDPIEIGFPVSDTMRIAEIVFFPSYLTDDMIPVLYLSDCVYISINRDGLMFSDEKGESFIEENWVFRWYKLTVAYSNDNIKLFVDDRCFLTIQPENYRGEGLSIKPIEKVQGNLLLDSIVIYELTEPKVSYTGYYRNGIPVYNLEKGGITHGATVYYANDKVGNITFVFSVTDKYGEIEEIKFFRCSPPTSDGCVYVECEFPQLPRRGANFNSFVWLAGVKPVGDAKKYKYN